MHWQDSTNWFADRKPRREKLEGRTLTEKKLKEGGSKAETSKRVVL